MKVIAVKVLAALALLAMLFGAILVTKFYFVDEWVESETHNNERHPYNCTIVSAFFTLGFNQSSASSPQLALLDSFHSLLRLVLNLRLPMVIFTDGLSAPFVADFRRSIGMENHTKIWNTSIAELPLSANISLFRAVVVEQQKRWEQGDNQSRVANHSTEFRILANSKSYFLRNASSINQFNTSAFAWLDPTYGHGNANSFPANFEWEPKFPAKKISLLKLSAANDSLRLPGQYDLNLNRGFNLVNSFIAGDSSAIEQFHALFTAKLFDQALVERVFDAEDQMILALAIEDRPALFNLVRGEWFNAFHLF